MKTKIICSALLTVSTISFLIVNNSQLGNTISTSEKINQQKLVGSDIYAESITPPPDQLDSNGGTRNS